MHYAQLHVPQTRPVEQASPSAPVTQTRCGNATGCGGNYALVGGGIGTADSRVPTAVPVIYLVPRFFFGPTTPVAGTQQAFSLVQPTQAWYGMLPVLCCAVRGTGTNTHPRVQMEEKEAIGFCLVRQVGRARHTATTTSSPPLHRAQNKRITHLHRSRVEQDSRPSSAHNSS